MTCIVAIVENDRVYMAADSLGGGNHDYDLRSDEKLFHNGEYLIGFTSSYRMGQLLQFADLPKPTGKDPFAFMVKTFIPFIRDLFGKAGFTTVSNNKEEGGVFLVAFGSNLFAVHEDFQVAKSLRKFDSVGSGHLVAKGALWALGTADLDPTTKLLRALEAAQAYNVYVRPPFMSRNT
jgi:ATP-dependent protease HslVU (ClpYQ) peptidase subunit